jgi:non-specific serine/threonine protein kinase/serine/threonine-protein kinase
MRLQGSGPIPDEHLAVVRKAIQPGREQRYASVDALAIDLQALIAQQPVGALPHTPRYVLRKFVQRNRRAVLGSALALAGLLGALFLAALGWWQADKQNQTTERTARFLSSILVGVRPEHAQGKDLSLMRQVLDDASARLPLELADAPSVQADIAATISETYHTLGDSDRAIETATAALAQARARLGEHHPATLALASRLARFSIDRGQSDRIAELDAIAHTQMRLFGESDAEAIYSAAYLSAALRGAGQIERALRLGEDLLARIVESLDNRAALELLMSETAIALAMSGDSEGALALQRRVIQSREERQGAGAFAAVSSRAEYGSTLFVSKRYDEALLTFRSVLPEYIRVFGPEHPQTLSIRGNVAAAQSLTGDAAGALPLTEALLEIRLRLHGRDHPETLLALGNVAATALRAGDLARAESAFREFIVLCDTLRQSSHPSCAERRAGLGKVLRQRGAFAEAERWLQASYRLKQQAEGKHFSGPEQVAAELALLYQAWGKPDEAARWQQLAAKTPDP